MEFPFHPVYSIVRMNLVRNMLGPIYSHKTDINSPRELKIGILKEIPGKENLGGALNIFDDITST